MTLNRPAYQAMKDTPELKCATCQGNQYHMPSCALVDHLPSHRRSIGVAVMEGETYQAGLPRAIDEEEDKWLRGRVADTTDLVNRPPHYTGPLQAIGIEVIQITELLPFTLGNVIKYVLRADWKGNALEDLRKARWYLDREIKRREKGDD